MYHACALLISGNGFVLEKQTPFMNPGPLLPCVLFITLQKQHSSCILSRYYTKKKCLKYVITQILHQKWHKLIYIFRNSMQLQK